MPAKVDLYKTHASDYVAPRKPILVEIDRAKYLAIEGRGKPGSDALQQDIGAMYAAAFTIKMASKFAGRDYAVSKLEGLWSRKRGDTWSWKILIRTPDFIGADRLDTALEQIREKGKWWPLASKVRLEEITEGRCVQMLHVGPYDEEAPTIAAMEEFAAGQGLRFHGLHHEIYLSDPRRVARERLRTILRHPVEPRRSKS